MLRAVPSIIRTACSTSRALRSAIFILAISSIWARVTVPTLSLFGTPEPLAMSGRLLQQHGRRRALGDELERAVVVDAHDDRNHHAAGFLRPLVELLHELAEVDAVLTERSADRRRRRGLPAGNLKLRLPANCFAIFHSCQLLAISC